MEVGGNDGILNSNTFHFELLGWRTLLVEPIPELCAKIRAHRPAATVVECAASNRPGSCQFRVAGGVDGMSTMLDDPAHLRSIHREGGTLTEITVPTRTLDDILATEGAPAVDFLTIDVEGAEMLVLGGLTLSRWKPRVMIIEDNSFGRDHAIIDYLRSHGYVNFHRTVVNDWFAAEGDQEILVCFNAAAFRRRRRWLPWHHRAKVIATAVLPPPVLRLVKRLVGAAPFSAAAE